MTPKRKKRISLIVLMLIGVSVGVTFALKALNENIMFFFSPADIQAGKAPENRDFRVGGVVVEGTVGRPGEGLTVEFDLTDNDSVVKVKYTGILPDLFREGQGIVANGRLNASGEFIAAEVLAKHDENYMPTEVMEAMKKSGQKMPDMSKGI
ncbi:MAG: cytochrome c maturation protein CcmE [Gammaproteobacteria bacterium]|jgi:cytochrome c-type biogenesis protein CcmE|nr:cytochrome c maturation protein CcmE [Gammaproteobacteria bacterium]MBT7081964.1 cytochrome c maturation protein CcmE [Chloroflexota bacterium]MBT3722871.1 cytochrome c maturation protein CcmE [Gammaproteobacteria bacterium]MBT4077878.1 cytochrome c maturation protein CcmE [Gammaproteobacteria bacterium]MBT4195412.1 cytochrome c maturation protein CcmE [Gammaproteobacteria bacterium]